ncbi:hypothetical protein ARALYDRAFT_920675 [Arabidopsis lyrata subsp. lyrata]|uniref:Uncharacterized protein n=1 Tax=Arabidopsis lyrata subsp. lyrata TaxID=81972 RepID=D7MXK0_ARALL|nr:hypothetical protein ARALYDRAFT_920675 [Arabidopsis lyrata subsp. lyrata]
MPTSFKVSHDPVRKLRADFCKSAIGRVASVDSGDWWSTLLRAYTKSIECEKSIQLILSMCLSEGFDILHTLLCDDGCCLIDHSTGVYGYLIEIQALFFMALRCAVLLLLKEDGEGTKMVEQIIKQLHALRSYFWLDLKQHNDIYQYKTEE